MTIVASKPAFRSADLTAGLAAAGARLVYPGVTDEKERARQTRFIVLMLAAPFVLAIAAAQAFSAVFDMPLLLGIVCAIFAAPWFIAVSVANTGWRRFAEILALVAGAAAVAAIVAASGGVASPAILLMAAPALEAWHVGRSRAAVLAGLCASVAGFLSIAAFAPPGAVPSDPAWLWAAPFLHGLSLWLRSDAASQLLRRSQPDIPQDLLAGLIEAVVIRLDRSGEVLDASGQSRELLGVAPELLLSTGLIERMHVGDRVAYLRALSETLNEGGRRKVEARLRLPQGADSAERAGHGEFLIELAAMPDTDGQVLGLIRDTSEMSGLRRALAASEEEARGTDLAKGRFLAAVSHELRTPLNAILGFSDILLHEMFGKFDDPRQREYVGLIRQSGDHLLSVVNSILDVSKIEAGAYTIEPEPFFFHEAVDMCHSMMAFQAKSKSLRLINKVGRETGEIRADRRAVQQMLINLVSNAIKFTPDGGEVVIGAGRVGSRLTFWVADTGIGIAGSDLARLGQPFMQVQNDYTRRFEGAGLGLSLVKGLVNLHQGGLSIESEERQGTTVSISLPVDGPTKKQGLRADRQIVSAAVDCHDNEADGHYPERAMTGSTEGPERKDGALRKTA